MKEAISVNNLTVSYSYKPVLWGITVSIPIGSVVAIVGPNGAGKSTLLKSILGLIPIVDGEVKILGKDIKKGLRAVTYVPQRDEVEWDFPITVYEVVLMARQAKKKLFQKISNRDKEVVKEALFKVGMWDYVDRQISDLSGGQQQRVFIARALASEADIFLLDEPFSGVDAATEKSIADIFKEMKNKGKTIIAVHHDLTTVPVYFDRVVFINTRLIAEGTVEEAFIFENLNKTFGGKLEVLSDIVNKVAHKSS